MESSKGQLRIADCGLRNEHSQIPNPKSKVIASPSPFSKRLKNGAIYYGVRGFLAIMAAVPRRVALDLCGVLGLCAYVCASDTRRRTMVNLQRVFGAEQHAGDIRRMAARVFWDLGKNVVDAVRLSRVTRQNIDRLVQARGLEYLAAAHALGHGVIAISGHIGNFELLGAYLALKGYPVTVVAATLYDPRLNAMLAASRARAGLRTVPRDRATPAALRALRRGDVVGLLIDQDTRVHGTFVDFFGQPAFTPVGPAVMALRTGAPVIPMAIHRQPDDTHLITVNPPIEPVRTGRPEHDIQETTQRYTAAIERLIRQAPTQWVWMHDRWKTRPA